METSRVCRKPDSKGQFNMRCRCFFTPRGEDEPRQCRAAAQRGTLYCTAHQTHDAELRGRLRDNVSMLGV